MSIDPILEKCGRKYCDSSCKFWSNFDVSEGVFTCSILASIVTILATTFFKYWVNTHEYCHNTYKYCHNPCEYWAGEYTLRACGGLLLWNWLLNLILTENVFKIASKLTSIVTILVSITLAGEHIFQVLAQYQYYQNTYDYCYNTCEYWAYEYTHEPSSSNMRQRKEIWLDENSSLFMQH